MKQREGAPVGGELAVDTDNWQRAIGQGEAEHLCRRETGRLEHKNSGAFDTSPPTVVAGAGVAPGALRPDGNFEQPAGSAPARSGSSRRSRRSVSTGISVSSSA